jgi:nascent polypeptide-associated complex subunit alpha
MALFAPQDQALWDTDEKAIYRSRPYKPTKVNEMFPGMGGKGINPRQLERQMKSMGIDMYEIEGVKQVIIKTADKDIVFNDAQVTVIDARGQKMYQVVGTPQERPLEIEIPEADITLVAQQAGVPNEVAKKALKDTNGDLAEAILKLSGNK